MSLASLTSPEFGEEGGVRPRYRSLIALAALVGGYVLSRRTPGVEAVAWLGAAQGCLAVAAACRGRVCKVSLVAAVVLLGAGWFGMRCREAPLSARPLLEAAEGSMVVELEGVITSAVREVVAPDRGPAFLRRPAARFELNVRAMIRSEAASAAKGVVLVRVVGTGAMPGPGSVVRLMGVLEPVASPINPGESDRRLWSAQDGRVGTLLVSSPELIRPVTSAAPGVVDRAQSVIARLRERARAGLARVLGDDENPAAAGMVQALLLGTYEPGVREVADAMSRVGLMHLLAISGFHLIVLARMGSLAFRVIGDPRGLEPWVIGGLVVAYAAVLPAEAPVLRAALMVLALLAAENCGRRYVRLSVLGWVACVLLLWRPMELWSLGFQLSFGIVGALLYTGRRWHERLLGSEGTRLIARPAPRTSLGEIRRFMIDEAGRAATTAVLAWLVAAPIVLHHTGLLSPLAIPATLLLTPIVAAMLVVGYPVLLLGLAWPWAGASLAPLLTEPAKWVSDGAMWLDGLPTGSLRLPAVSAGFAACAFAAVVIGARSLSWRRLGAVLCALVFWLGAEVWVAPAMSWRGLARVDALSVGDGSCLLVRCRDGALGTDAILWDCGSLRRGLGDRVLARALRELG
ncbi:MAG: ComEC/Rec2 family competence protein, partial [Phycisphaerales bacterium]|nr:ComEC/Rec2 family competence protein [Phycisphaerales bacterium]